LVVELSSAREDENRWCYCSVNSRQEFNCGLFARQLRRELGEADENPLLEAVAKERQLKIQQAGKKGLGGAVRIFELWRLAVAL
jgi:hypothetical protein